ncbi:MAG TPA: hypothetical protein VFC64_01090 [Atopostipes sp.]|nr:hypothetical protein [Atopostipes sp.]
MAKLKLMIDRLSEKEKNAIKNEIAEAERKAELEVLRAEKEAEQMLVEEKEKLMNDLEYDYSMKENTERVNYRNAVLKEKQRVIHQTFKDAKEQLANISKEDFMGIVMSALDNVDVTQRVEIFVGEKTKQLMDKEWLQQQLPWNNHVNVQEETVKNKAGLLVRMNNIDYNYFFDELIAENRTELLSYVTNELFEENK